MPQKGNSGLISIHDLQPLEEGGSLARQGFLYQDHVAAAFCIEMLSDERLTEVWCETEDDVTLLWEIDGATLVEFVQVKATEPDQLWTVALLCNGGEKSIVAKSIAHDRCAEPCCFRLVTRQNVKSEVRPLLLAPNHRNRHLTDCDTLVLHKDVCKRFGDLVSPRGRSVSNWLADMLWDVRESEKAIIDANSRRLGEFLEAIAEYLFTDQMKELYEAVLLRVQRAASAKWAHGADMKKLRRAEFVNWLVSTAQRIKGRPPSVAGASLHKKMKEAGIPNDAIDNADRIRWEYRTLALDPRYQQDDELRGAELETVATLQQLLSKLDARSLSDNGRQFHARCLDALGMLRNLYPAVGLRFLQGTMYAATDRCRHRFLKAPL